LTKRNKFLLTLTSKLVLVSVLIGFVIKGGYIKIDDFKDAISRWPLLLAALATMALIPAVGAWRWFILLRCQGFQVTYLRTLHLSLVGMFFNCFGIGYTGGGDIVKAYYVASDQPSGRRAEAVYSVGFDRAIGLYALVALGTIALTCGLLIDYVPVGSETVAGPKLKTITAILAAILLAITVVFQLAFSKRFRENKYLAAKIEKIPGGKFFLRFYRSIKLYRAHNRVLFLALFLSAVAHCAMFMAMWLMALALNMHQTLTSPALTWHGFVFCVAIGLTLSSVGTPLGLGVGQLAFGQLFMRIWGEAGKSAGGALATLHQVAMFIINMTLGLPAFLLVRSDYSRIVGDIVSDQKLERENAAPDSNNTPAVVDTPGDDNDS